MDRSTEMMGRRKAIRNGLLFLLGGFASRSGAEDLPSASGTGAVPTLQGFLRVHDPSTIIRDGNTYWVFSTGNGIGTRFSNDMVNWEQGPNVFATPPDWTAQAVPGFRGYFWAPDIIRLNNTYYLYYAVSRFNSQVSAIGLATNPTLDPQRPDYRWTDCGPIIQSGRGDTFNAIDPALFDDADGKLWMSFGSFWNGIMLTELDPATGRRIIDDSTIYPLARHGTIEASYLYHRGTYYYLFVNWGFCCRGVNSTYNIRVGRSTAVTGPYLDRNGRDLLHDGGTLVLKTVGTRIGPGQTGIFSAEGREWFSYHYYDATQGGKSMLGLQPLRWSADGWPVLS
jgi:arabinan endo-1,5-alpha-L-arabinosidase